ncbi:hypothetical protein Tco_0746377 [Tanacetum coccineum]
MAPKRTTRSKPATPTPNEPTTTVTEAQLQALIDQGVAAAMAEAEASRVRNGYNSNGTEVELSDLSMVEKENWSLLFSISNLPRAGKSSPIRNLHTASDALTCGYVHVKDHTREKSSSAMTWTAMKKMND